MCRRLQLIAAGWGLVLAAGPSAGQPVAGQVTVVGMRARSQSNFAVRSGCWVPLLCDLKLQVNDHFEGELVCEQSDLDGDIVSYRQPIVLSSDKRVWLYAATKPREQSTMHVHIVDKQGTRVNTLDVPPVDVFHHDYFILDISERPAAQILGLHGASALTGDLLVPRQYYRPVAVGVMTANELPDRWWGLESVDVVVWDKPDPDKLNPAQADALVEWVRNGGQLVLGIGPAWRRIQKSRLSELVPFAPDAPTVVVDDLPEFFGRFGRSSGATSRVGAPIEVVAGGAARGFRVLRDTAPDGKRIDLLTAAPAGNGRVMAFAASLADVFQKSAVKREFFGQLFELSPFLEKWQETEGEQHYSIRSFRLAPAITQRIDFSGLGQLLRVAAVLFVGGYILAAVFVTWTWLARKGMAHLSWSVFAGCAVVASVLSMLAVNFTGGFSARVNCVQFLDLDAGTTQGSGRCWIGYRSPRRKVADFTLEGEGAYLRAKSPSGEAALLYATPTRYSTYAVAIPPAQPHVAQAVMRASLKQFEGFWRGPLDGTIRGQIVVDRGTGRVADESWIKNDLAVEITRGWLLYIDPRVRETRVQSLLREWSGTKPNAVPASNILIVPIGSLKPTDRIAGFARALNQKLDNDISVWRAGAAESDKAPDLPTLRAAQLDWSHARDVVFSNPTDEESALLASTRGYYVHMKESLESVSLPLDGDGMVDCDVSDWLLSDQVSAGQAVLLAFSPTPGPARLTVDGAPVRMHAGMTLYRVRMPVVLIGTPPPRPSSNADESADDGGPRRPARREKNELEALLEGAGGSPP